MFWPAMISISGPGGLGFRTLMSLTTRSRSELLTTVTFSNTLFLWIVPCPETEPLGDRMMTWPGLLSLKMSWTMKSDPTTCPSTLPTVCMTPPGPTTRRGLRDAPW